MYKYVSDSVSQTYGFYYICCNVLVGISWVMMVVVAPIRAIAFISRQKINANDLYITLCWIYIATKVLGYSSDLIVEDMGRVDNIWNH